MHHREVLVHLLVLLAACRHVPPAEPLDPGQSLPDTPGTGLLADHGTPEPALPKEPVELLHGAPLISGLGFRDWMVNHLVDYSPGVADLALLPNGSLLLARGDGLLATADPLTGESRDPFAQHACGVEYLAVDPRGELVAASSGDGRVALWPIDVERNTGGRGYPGIYVDPLAVILPQPRMWAGAAHVKWTHDGTHLLTWTADERNHPSPTTVQLWSRSGELVWTGFHARWADVSPTENLIAAVRRDEVLLSWPGERQETLELPYAYDTVEFSPDGTLVAVGGNEGRLWIVEVANGAIEVETQIDGIGEPLCGLTFCVQRAHWSPSGRLVGVSLSPGLTPAVVDAESGRLVWTAGFIGAQMGTVFDVAWTPDERLVTGLGETFVADPTTGESIVLAGNGFKAVIPTGDGSGFYFTDGEQVRRIDSLAQGPTWIRDDLPYGRAVVARRQ